VVEMSAKINAIYSLVIYSDFGFFKKPDMNENFLTYNFIPKPAVLGILGAIQGLSGYNKKNIRPEFYEKQQGIRVGITPGTVVKTNSPPYYKFTKLEMPLLKTFVKYNNYHGYGSYESGGIANIVEQLLIKPAYRIFIENPPKSLISKLEKNESHFIPYMGKNEFLLSYIYEGQIKYSEVEKMVTMVDTIIFKEFVKKPILGNDDYSFLNQQKKANPNNIFCQIYENYPYELREDLHYNFKEVIYSTLVMELDLQTLSKEKNCKLVKIKDNSSIFLF